MRETATKTLNITASAAEFSASAILTKPSVSLCNGWFYIERQKGQGHNIYINTAASAEILIESAAQSQLDLYITNGTNEIRKLNCKTFSRKTNTGFLKSGNYKIIVINRGNKEVKYYLKVNIG